MMKDPRLVKFTNSTQIPDPTQPSEQYLDI